MKESEAKEKWCPMGVKEVRTYSSCLGSKCMWWVWDDYTDMETPLPEKLDGPIGSGVEHGHCGHIPMIYQHQLLVED